MLQPGSAVLEILPDGFKHKGFRNLVQMLGLGYFWTHTKMHGDASGGNQWQNDAMEIDKQRFVDMVNYAVRSLYSKGMKNFDVF